MVRDEAKIQRTVLEFRELALQGDKAEPQKIIHGWELLGQLNEATENLTPHPSIHAIIDALTKKIPADHSDEQPARIILFLATQTKLGEGGAFVQGCTPAEKEAIKTFAQAMREAVLRLSLSRSL